MFQLSLTQEECSTLFELIALDFIDVGEGKVVKQFKTVPTEEAEDLMRVLQLFTDDELFLENHQYAFGDRLLMLDRELYQLLALEVFFRLKKKAGHIPFRWMKTLKGIADKLTPFGQSFQTECAEECSTGEAMDPSQESTASTPSVANAPAVVPADDEIDPVYDLGNLQDKAKEIIASTDRVATSDEVTPHS